MSSAGSSAGGGGGRGTVAVVTGAGRGFGREIARRLAARGHEMVLTDLDEAALASASAELGGVGMVADARSADDHRRVAVTAQRRGRVAVWVNNAGVLRAGRAWELSDADVALQLDVNLAGVVHGSRAAVGVLRERGGHLLNIASMSAHGPVPGLAVYAATKAAVLNFSLSLQGDLDAARIPVRVHALCPDAADTALVRDQQERPETAILFSRPALLTPGQVADAAVDLLDGRRLVRSLPAHRAVMARTGALLPTVALRVLDRLRAQGEGRRAAT